jgi:hypothetical protein
LKALKMHVGLASHHMSQNAAIKPLPELLAGGAPPEERRDTGPNEAVKLPDADVECIQNNLTNMRRLALGSDVRAEVQGIEREYILTGFITQNQIDILKCYCLQSNGHRSLASLNKWKANYQSHSIRPLG